MILVEEEENKALRIFERPFVKDTCTEGDVRETVMMRGTALSLFL